MSASLRPVPLHAPWLLVWVLLLAPPAAAADGAAPPVGYAQAGAYHRRESRPALHQPLHLLDGREATGWCSAGADPLGQLLLFGFKEPVRIDEVRITTGHGRDAEDWRRASRARALFLQVRPRGVVQRLEVQDTRGPQSLPLEPPLEGTDFVLEVVDLYPAEDPEAPVCVSDVVFYSGGRALNGPWLAPHLGYDARVAALLGTWYGGEKRQPSTSLSFFFDGTYRYVHRPFDEAQPATRWEGAYRVRGERLTLELPGGKRVRARLRREGPDTSGVHTLTLEGELPPPLRQPLRDQP